MFVVPIEQGGPLLWTDPQSRLHCHANDLPIMLTTKRLIGAKLGKERREGGRERGREGGKEGGRDYYFDNVFGLFIADNYKKGGRGREGRKVVYSRKAGSVFLRITPFLREFVPCLPFSFLHSGSKKRHPPQAQEAQTSV